MSLDTILTLANGKGIDLRNPCAADISFEVMAEHLAKENRYNGATPGIVYSVAQHTVHGTDLAFGETGDEELAGYFVLHDGHEHTLKDDTTPKKRALAEEIAAECGVLAPVILACFDRVTDRHDAAIHEAAGLPWPPSPEMKARIKHYDLRLFVTEWRDLMRGIPHPHWAPYEGVEPMSMKIQPLHWKDAKARLVHRLHRYLPALRRRR